MQDYAFFDEPPTAVRDELKEHPPLLQELLYHRGIATKEAARSFLSPDYTRDVHDPFLFRDMEKAVLRVQKAMKEGERIVVYSDYDCDGGRGLGD